MLQVHDIRETRVYQEAKEEGLKAGKEEGLKEGKEEGLKEGIAIAIVKMAASKMPAAETAAILEVRIEQVNQVLAGANRG